MRNVYYIGWDVGAWSCKRSSNSCDALVILDENKKLVGKPYRDSIKEIINQAENTQDFLTIIFDKCGLIYNKHFVILAIDAPLGYSEAFIQLVSKGIPFDGKFDKYSDNPYLFRMTEKHLFDKKIINDKGKVIHPLSAVNDRIGSQSTKGMHVIAKFAPNILSCGEWTDDTKKLKIIETYPSVCRSLKLKNTLNEITNQDIKDALICAEIAYIFENERNKLVAPLFGIPEKEGWIWTVK